MAICLGILMLQYYSHTSDRKFVWVMQRFVVTQGGMQNEISSSAVIRQGCALGLYEPLRLGGVYDDGQPRWVE